VDLVHQVVLDRTKGLCAIKLVDAVTKFEVVITVERISELFPLTALEQAPEAFPMDTGSTRLR
jgi:hypothetical protein